LVRRAQIVLRSADGESNAAIAERFEVSAPLVAHWRRRYRAHGLAGLYGALRSGRPRTHEDDEVASLVRTVLKTRPKDATHWSVGLVAAKTGIGKSTVQRYYAGFGVQPHRTKSFKLSTDPFFVEKVRDVVGLYLNPPENAFVSASMRRARSRPSNGRSPSCRSGSAMSKASRTTTSATARRPSSRRSTFRAATCSRNPNVGIAIKNSSAFFSTSTRVFRRGLTSTSSSTTMRRTKHANVKAWLARRPRFHLYFTPTYASWLNQVERWFGPITQRVIRRGSFRTVRELARRIDTFITHYDSTARPSTWTATADSILAKVERLAKAINGTSH
jgi:transposase